MSTRALAPSVAADRDVWRFAVFVGEAWRGVTARQVLYVFMLCLALGLIYVASHISNLVNSPTLTPAINAMLSAQLNGFAVMFAVLVADRVSSPELRRWWPYVLAVAVGAVIGSSLLWFVSQRLLSLATPAQVQGLRDGYGSFVYRHGIHSFVYCGLATFVYVRRRWGAHRLAVLREMQLECVEIERRALESRLSAMQARVEPRFLMNTLARLESLYEQDASAADRMLKELTVYLRAAIPQIRDPISTVSKEALLAQAFLHIVGVDANIVPSPHSLDASPIAVARIPPMIVLPLLNHALTHRSIDPTSCVRIEFAMRGASLHLCITHSGAGFAPESALDPDVRELRERLAVLCGDRAQLVFELVGDGTCASVNFPYEEIAPPYGLA